MKPLFYNIGLNSTIFIATETHIMGEKLQTVNINIWILRSVKGMRDSGFSFLHFGYRQLFFEKSNKLHFRYIHISTLRKKTIDIQSNLIVNTHVTITPITSKNLQILNLRLVQGRGWRWGNPTVPGSTAGCWSTQATPGGKKCHYLHCKSIHRKKRNRNKSIIMTLSLKKPKC